MSMPCPSSIPRPWSVWRCSLTSFTLIGCALLTLGGCRSLEARFYQPAMRDALVPDDVEERIVEADDGTRIQTWFLPAPSLRDGSTERAPVVLFCHGSQTQIDEIEPMLRPVVERADVSLSLVSYRGYGRSEATTSLSRRATLADARTALLALAERDDVEPGRMLVMGYSLGAIPALALAAEFPEVAGAIVGGAYGRTRDVLGDEGYGALTWLIGSGLDPVDAAEELAGRPVLLFHGEDDVDVPVYHAFEIGSDFVQAGVDLEFMLVPEAGHRNVLTTESPLVDVLVEFLRRVGHAPLLPDH